MFKDSIIKKSQEIKDELIRIRRDIHAHPEPGRKEFRTSALIAEKMKELGLEVRTNVADTGVVATLRGKYPGKTILLRADMDCLPVTEQNDVEYKSQNPGFMHACGHDTHTTWVIGAAMILSQFKDQLHGNVKFLFQPDEEFYGGADRMIKDGALENPHVDAAIGAHVWPIIESGKIGVKYGSMMASPDHISINIYGKAGHGAEPHNCIDPISVACQVYMSLQTLVSRRINPVEPAVVTIARITGGTTHNAIPEKVEMEGTVRTLTNELRSRMPQLIENIIKGVCEANEAAYEFAYDPYYPPVINNNEMTILIEKAGKEILGEDNVIVVDKPTMGAEDFSYFQQKVPGVFFIVGTYNKEKGLTSPLHNPKFNVDEDIIPRAAAVLAQSALTYLNDSTHANI
ncbi:MAG: amidohydrolase [Clostridiaceae bacterium]|nr:amidohydrolase [Clostridiaceae bacterium]